MPQSENLPEGKYYFLPLQVTNDTQLFLNSDIDNEGALEFGDTAEEKVLILKKTSIGFQKYSPGTALPFRSGSSSSIVSSAEF